MTRIAALAISTLICTFPAHAIEPERLSDIDNVVTAFGDATVCGSEVEFRAVEGENIVELAADSSETTVLENRHSTKIVKLPHELHPELALLTPDDNDEHSGKTLCIPSI